MLVVAPDNRPFSLAHSERPTTRRCLSIGPQAAASPERGRHRQHPQPSRGQAQKQLDKSTPRHANWKAARIRWTADPLIKMGRWKPHPVWGFKNIKGRGVGWRVQGAWGRACQLALYSRLCPKRGLTGLAGRYYQIVVHPAVKLELETGWPDCFELYLTAWPRPQN